jgi:hypothetical protein
MVYFEAPVRRVLLALLVVALLPALAGAASARPAEVAGYGYGAGAQAPDVVHRAGQAPTGFTGGAVTASTGETVNLFVDDALAAADPNALQSWAEFMVGLLHGPEISTVTVYLTSLDRVREMCGRGALGCYGRGRIVALGQDVGGVSAKSVLTHEYGHHVASNRANDPWRAVDYGTKRWASYLNVCSRAQSGQLHPGNEGSYYELNPGEAFAEVYRLLNERRAGLPETAWQVVDQSLYPDQTSLDLLAQDVTSPWQANTSTSFRGTMTARATGRGFRVSTPLDGSFVATLTVPPKAKLLLRVVDPANGNVLATSSSGLRVQSVPVSVCGHRTLQLQVKRISGSGTFTLAVSQP